MRIRKMLLGAAAAVAGLAWVGSAVASTIEIKLVETGFPDATSMAAGLTPGPSSVTLTPGSTIVFGDFTITNTSATATESSGFSDLLGTTLQVVNNAGSAKTLDVFVTEDHFSLPSGTPLNFASSIGGNVTLGTLGVKFQGYADASDALFGTASTAGPVSVSGVTAPMSFNLGPAITSFARAGDFSLTSDTTLTLSGNGVANYSNSVVVTAAPLPATAGTGLSLFAGLGALVGLRKLTSRRVGA